MEVTEKRLENASTRLEITVQPDVIADQYEKEFQKIQKTAKVDGFRKGKVPIDIIRKKFRSSAQKDVLEALIRNNYIKALEQLEIRPIDHPQCDFDSFEEEKPFTFTAVVDLYPEITLSDYTSIAVEEAQVTVTDDDVTKEIENIREKHATLTEKEDGLVEEGNQVQLKVREVTGGDESRQPNTMTVIADKSDKPYEFDSHVVGMRKGEEKEIDITYPKDYNISSLAGETLTYTIKVEDVHVRTLPSLDDEFAKDLGEYETLDELKAKTREDIEKYTQQRARGNAKNEILSKIIEKSSYEIPGSLVAREKESIFNRMKQRFNLSIDDPGIFAALMGMDKDAFDQKLVEEAKQSIKTTLTLSEIAKTEKIEVNDEEYMKRLEELAAQYQKSAEELKSIFEKNGAVENIKSDMLFDKAMDFIYDNAKIKKTKPQSLEKFMNPEA